MSPELDRRRFLLLTAGATFGVGLLGCSDDDGNTPDGGVAAGATAASALAAPGSAGLMDEATYQARIDAFLAHATSVDHSSNPVGTAAHLIRAAREPDYEWNVGGVSVESFADVF